VFHVGIQHLQMNNHQDTLPRNWRDVNNKLWTDLYLVYDGTDATYRLLYDTYNLRKVVFK